MTHHDDDTRPELTRRRMLVRLGLAATAIYAAPIMLQLSQAGAASSFSGASRSGPSRSGPSFSGPSFSRSRSRRPADGGNRAKRAARRRGARFTSFSR